jgi:hypothetical protein
MISEACSALFFYENLVESMFLRRLALLKSRADEKEQDGISLSTLLKILVI